MADTRSTLPTRNIHEGVFASCEKVFLNIAKRSADTPAVIILLDINMTKKNGLEVLEEIRKKKMDVKVLVLTIHNEVEYLLRAVEIGIEGYILKDSESAALKK